MISIVGYGSQGAAWAECLRLSGQNPQVVLRPGSSSLEKVQKNGFTALDLKAFRKQLIESKGEQSHLIAMLCPDDQISHVYDEVLSDLPRSFCLVLGHGFSVYSGRLKMKNPMHEVALLAPKAIASELEKECVKAKRKSLDATHGLSAGYFFPKKYSNPLNDLSRGLGFSSQHMIPATFDEETIGDLISEQVLLCGGIFPLLSYCMEAMKKAGVPEKLIKEECLTEMSLMVNAIRAHGVSKTFLSISEAAQAGTVLMKERLEKSGIQNLITEQVETVLDRKFVADFEKGEWKIKRDQFAEELRKRETQ